MGSVGINDHTVALHKIVIYIVRDGRNFANHYNYMSVFKHGRVSCEDHIGQYDGRLAVDV